VQSFHTLDVNLRHLVDIIGLSHCRIHVSYGQEDGSLGDIRTEDIGEPIQALQKSVEHRWTILSGCANARALQLVFDSVDLHQERTDLLVDGYRRALDDVLNRPRHLKRSLAWVQKSALITHTA